MFISSQTTVAQGTTPKDPIVTKVKVCAGTITKITIKPAPGPRGEVYAKIRYRENSIFPQNEDEWIPLETYPVEITPMWSDWDGTYVISLLFCAPQARYSHIVDVDIEILETPTINQAFDKFVMKGY